MASPTLQFKRGSAAAGVGTVPALRPGEPAFSTNFFDLFVGFDTSVNGNKFFGSHRYWKREDGTNSLHLKLVDKDGTNSIGLKAPDTLAGITTYTLPATPSDGYFLKTNATGELEWASVTGSATFDNASLTGITTITNVTIQGGSINSTTIGLTTAAAGAFTTLSADSLNVSGIATVGSVSIGATQVVSSAFELQNIASLDATTTATIEAAIANAPNTFTDLNVSGISTIGGLLNANAGLDVTGHTELDNLNVSGIATFTSAIDADLLGNAGTATSLATGRNIAVSGIVTGTAYFDGTSDITISTTIQNDVIGLGTHTYGDYVKDVTGTANQIAVTGSGEGASVVLSLPNDVVVGTSLSVSTLKTATIQHSNGTEAITIDVGGNVGVSTNLTVTGNLVVNGSTTTIETETLLVKDSLIEVGLVDNGSGGLIAPSSDANIDVGMLFHYYSGTAKKAAVYWDDSTSRITFADDVSEANNVLTATAYATVLAGGLEINNACTGGTDEVISCANGELTLSNIVVDGGFFA